MAYSQPIGSNGKASTFVVVAGLHAVAIYAIVTGLAVSWQDKIKPPEFRSTFVPTENTKIPEPSPSASVDPAIIRDPVPVPLPPIGGAPPVPFDWGSPAPDQGSGGGLGINTIELVPPVPLPSPGYAPKGPRPRGKIGDWVRQSDYPSVGLHREYEGLTRVQLSVGTTGKVTNCAVSGSSGHHELDEAACAALVRRGKFEPATDGSGAASGGTYSTTVRWQLPE